MAGAAFNTGKSRQDYQTPLEFRVAVKCEFGPVVWDLAATAQQNISYAELNYFGPDHPEVACRDALVVPWGDFTGIPVGLRWLNPPFANIKPWAKKCAHESSLGVEILFLVPASVGSNWFWDYVAPYAHVYALSPRLSFDGKHPFPKDLILAHYKPQRTSGVVVGAASHGFSRWQWKL